MDDLKQKPDPKDDVNPKFVPEGGDCLCDALDEHMTSHADDDGNAVGSLGNTRKPYKVK
jgi:hypothetical protein